MAHTYWRLNITNSCRDAGATTIAELKFFDSGGTQIATTGGTPSASSTASGTAPANAFDGNPATIWASNARATSGSPQWVQYQFSSAVDAVSISVTIRGDGNLEQAPIDMALQYSDTGSSFTTLYTWYGVNWSARGQTKTLGATNAAVTSLAIAWRLLITANNGFNSAPTAAWIAGHGYTIGNTVIDPSFHRQKCITAGTSGGSAPAWNDGGGTTTDGSAVWQDSYLVGTVAVAEWTLYDPTGLAIPTGGFSDRYSTVAHGEPDGGGAAFDGNTSTYWASDVPALDVPEYIEYDFATSVTVASFCVTPRGDLLSQAPTQFSLQSSPDRTTWTTVGAYLAFWPNVATQCWGNSPFVYVVV